MVRLEEELSENPQRNKVKKHAAGAFLSLGEKAKTKEGRWPFSYTCKQEGDIFTSRDGFRQSGLLLKHG